MEERKRPAPSDHDDSAPPSKRQATAINGSSKNHHDSDLPGKDELERFQKEAIIRQMQEYKREKTTLEKQLSDLTSRAEYHDDHLRTIDSWFSQLLDEVNLCCGKVEDITSASVFPSSLLSADNAAFEKHLSSRSEVISSAISNLFKQKPDVPPEVAQLQARISQLLATEKNHLNELEKSRLEKEQLEERLESASMRYMLAEKKLDRAKSMTVAKLEQQAIAGGRSEAGSGLGGGADGSGPGNTDVPNGAGVVSERLSEIESAHKEVVAASAKKQEQIEKLSAENEKLIAQTTAMTIKLSSLSDDDYAHTDLFKHLKAQHEDVIKRVNDLAATHVHLREQVEKLQAERTSYKIQLEAETKQAVEDKDKTLAQAESDLARIRTARDELSAELAIRKAGQDQERASIKHSKQLLAAREERIKALESETERLKLQIGQSAVASTANLDGISTEELKSKYANINQQNSMLNQELSSMDKAYRKANQTAALKISEFINSEEVAKRLNAEKEKANQKYFSAMKLIEAKSQECRTQRAQNSKSSDIVSQLKEAEAATRSSAVNLEKTVSEAKEALYGMTKQHRTAQQEAKEKGLVADGLKKQVEDLKKALVTKDSTMGSTLSSLRKAEVEIEELKVKNEETKKSLESWKTKGLGNQTGEYEMLRNLALCTVCRKNFKDTVVKTCGHVFCRDCVEERLQSRMRKCPNCNKAFGANDHMRITL
ncbi:MAG: E3 ubiquitin-protein ligase bre1 [Icmadophila ericetorum]|nr:E3 ubiquitin-protein ligase bre1 [Icmadophila ericetorum]